MSYQEYSTNTINPGPGVTKIDVARDINIGTPQGSFGEDATLIVKRSASGTVTWPSLLYASPGQTPPELPAAIGSWVVLRLVNGAGWYEVSRSVYDAGA